MRLKSRDGKSYQRKKGRMREILKKEKERKYLEKG